MQNKENTNEMRKDSFENLKFVEHIEGKREE